MQKIDRQIEYKDSNTFNITKAVIKENSKTETIKENKFKQ